MPKKLHQKCTKPDIIDKNGFTNRFCQLYLKFFYTIHDCIGCKASDAEKVKAAMLEVAKETVGAKLNIKLESGSGKTVLDGFKFIKEEVVMKKKGWSSKMAA